MYRRMLLAVHIYHRTVIYFTIKYVFAQVFTDQY